MQQVTLSKEQVADFYHDCFVASQVQCVIDLAGPQLAPGGGVVADIGGGCGFFAKALAQRTGAKTRVLDTDPESIRRCREAGIDAELSDALNPAVQADETLACFNLILHHLVGSDEKSTRALQAQALRAWRGTGVMLFINEYIYESYWVDGLSGYLIYRVTSSRILSMVGRMVSKMIPSLRANTFGVGVRFRSRAEWVALFEWLGFNVVGYVRGAEEGVSLARRMLFIRSCRKDSFLLFDPRLGAPVPER